DVRALAAVRALLDRAEAGPPHLHRHGPALDGRDSAAGRVRGRANLLAEYAGKGGGGGAVARGGRGGQDQLLRGDRVHGPERRRGFRSGHHLLRARPRTELGEIHAWSAWPRTS